MTTDAAVEEVRAAYRWVLGREPDTAGLEFHAAAMAAGTLDRRTLRQLMLSCPEFVSERGRFRAIDLLDGVTVVANPDDGDIGHAIAYHRCWEPHLTDLLRATLREGDVFLDIGANIGVMSFVAAKAVGPSGKVIGFEPNPVNAANHRRGILANGFQNILLHNLAVSDRPSTVAMTPHTNAKASEVVTALGAEDVIQAVALDDFLAHEPRIDLIKIDIEGYEFRAFQGMDALLRRHQPQVQIEFNPICLEHQGGIEPRLFADLIFELSMGPIDAIELDGSRTAIASAAALMEEWAARDRQAVKMGWLPAGWAHMDLLMRVRAAEA